MYECRIPNKIGLNRTLILLKSKGILAYSGNGRENIYKLNMVDGIGKRKVFGQYILLLSRALLFSLLVLFLWQSLLFRYAILHYITFIIRAHNQMESVIMLLSLCKYFVC